LSGQQLEADWGKIPIPSNDERFGLEETKKSLHELVEEI
jgi:hypothetical protein